MNYGLGKQNPTLELVYDSPPSYCVHTNVTNVDQATLALIPNMPSLPNWRELWISLCTYVTKLVWKHKQGDMYQIVTLKALPPRDSCVILQCSNFFLMLSSPRRNMQFAKMSKPTFILELSPIDMWNLHTQLRTLYQWSNSF